MTLFKREYTVTGIQLMSVGLDDVWVVNPADRTAVRVSGFIQYSGMLIVESLLTDCPPDPVLIFDPHSSPHENILRLH